MKKTRIVERENILGGKPIIEGTRIPVSAVLDQLKNGGGKGHVRDMYPHLRRADIDAALEYASRTIDERYQN